MTIVTTTDRAIKSLAADESQVRQFLSVVLKHSLKSKAGYLCLRSLPNAGEEGPPWVHAEPLGGKPVAQAVALATEAANATPGRVFSPPVCIFGDMRNDKGRVLAVERNVISCPVVVAELDKRPEETLAAATALLGPPTILVRSGGAWQGPDGAEDKLHVYWRLAEPAVGEDRDRLKHARKLLALLIGSDTSAVPLAHPLRLPGSWHTKAEPRLCVIDEARSDFTRDVVLDEALDALKAAAEAAGLDLTAPRGAAPPPGGFKDPTPMEARELELVAQKVPNTSQSWEAWNRMGMAFYSASHGSADGLAAFQAWSEKLDTAAEDSPEERWAHYPSSPPTDIGAGTLRRLAEEADPMFKALVHLDAVPLAVDAPSSRRKLELVSFSDMAARATLNGAEPLIKGLLDQGAMTVLYGDSNVGKTFVALRMAYDIANGRQFGGMKTTPGLVVYVAAEGGRAISRRILALHRKHGPAERFLVLPSPVNLRDPNADIGPLLDMLADLPERPILIVIDTLSRVIAGGEENSSVDMGALVASFDRIRAATGSHLMVVHHTGKVAAKGARGHSLLRAATDTELEVENGRVSSTKQRDLDGSWSSGFKLDVLALWPDEDGEIVTSCVAELVDENEGIMPKLRPADRRVFMDAEMVQASRAERYATEKELSIAGGERGTKPSINSIRVSLQRIRSAGHSVLLGDGKWRVSRAKPDEKSAPPEGAAVRDLVRGYAQDGAKSGASQESVFS